MPPATIPRIRNPRRVARYLLLVFVPLAILLKTCIDRERLPQTTPGFEFTRPSGWNYLTETTVKPDGDRIRFNAEAVAAAFADGHTAPLFALTKYPPPGVGLNPIIGLNLAWERDAAPVDPQVLLERSVAEVQSRADDGLVVLEPIGPISTAGGQAARVVLATRGTPAEGKVADRLTVVAVVQGQLSFLVAASGAASGSDVIDGELRTFVDSLRVEAAAPP